jgi:signal transduction histidine kinase
VQASMGIAAFDRQPEQTRRALANVERSSSDALTELRGLLGVLRGTDGARVALTPAPSLRDVDSLAANVERSGIAITVTSDELSSLPTGVDAFGYRIVQEALTNVVRHVGPTRVQLRVAVDGDRVRLEVNDEGGGRIVTAVDPAGTGHGTVGMRERALLYGGELSIGPGPNGGWQVAGWLPCRAVQR